MTILIYGVSGRTGGAVADLAVSRDHKVVGVIRDPKQADDLEKRHIHTVVLDIATATVAEHTALLHKLKPSAVVWAAGTSQDALGRAIDYQAQVNVYDAMVQARVVERVVAVSSMGVWDKDSKGAEWFSEDDLKRVNRLREFVPNVVQGKYDAEKHLHSLKLDWTVIRPGGLNQNEAAGVSLGKVHVGLVPRATVAKVVLGSIHERGMHGRTIDCIEGTDGVRHAIDHVVHKDIDTWV